MDHVRRRFDRVATAAAAGSAAACDVRFFLRCFLRCAFDIIPDKAMTLQRIKPSSVPPISHIYCVKSDVGSQLPTVAALSNRRVWKRR
jgi:hypothetical protein